MNIYNVGKATNNECTAISKIDYLHDENADYTALSAVIVPNNDKTEH